MASEQTFTSDLRSDAKEFNRDKNSRAKWQHGTSFGPGRRVEEGRPRPARVSPNMKSPYPGPWMKARNALTKDITYASGDSSADEDVEHPSSAPAPDAEVAYSFDATRGPSHGSQILNGALEKAIERYEIRETDKLIKNEYEVLDSDGEAISPAPKKRNAAPEDEDYEFVDA
ncbi:hypothetical protein P153DRAFT_282555 [Dothidotthia symphoricarpi CBS 119687]|uniref:Uncharacterized protein n=1 Tax=Dothidotthia symphoricarpi CBS 119687 TaxID=1392245 RepID=A0A6A6ARV0_9PLEO|nr:uncharacterized protein P153DRAFT_282555 [Dothidotthia symphoricarpi CBS 119687]KAF2133577.1 hypothetical protein P153DRAFT_282555 [Dothidotthia symphoricarpi CBS 119687]